MSHPVISTLTSTCFCIYRYRYRYSDGRGRGEGREMVVRMRVIARGREGGRIERKRKIGRQAEGYREIIIIAEVVTEQGRIG